ncbi:MAG: extracellular solute-binding protein [Clostridiales bacterium]|nr:extracellular solute-binding protein [Clostridiales bacterium]
MRVKCKRILALLLIICLSITSVSCHKSTKKNTSETVKEQDPFFQTTVKEIRIEPEIDRKIQYFEQRHATIAGNSVIASYEVLYEYSPEMNKMLNDFYDTTVQQIGEVMRKVQEFYERGLVIFDFDGNPLSKIELPYNSEVVNLFPDRDGDIICLVEHMDFETLEYWRELLIYSTEGLLKETVKIPEGSLINPQHILVTADGSYILSDYSMIMILSHSGEVLGQLEDPELNGSVVEAGDKYYALLSSFLDNGQAESISFSELDIKTCSLKGEKRKLDTDIGDVVSGGDGKCYTIDGNGIHRVDLSTGSLEEILNWNSTDVNYYNYDPNSFRIISENKSAFLRSAAETDKVTGDMIEKTYAVSLSKADKNPHAGKKYIAIGTIGIPSNDLLDYIVAYNTEEGNTSRIRVKDYNTVLAPDLSFSQRQTILSDKVYEEMISGKGPDILVDFSCFSQFNSEEILVDLNKYVDGPNGLNRTEYFDNILSAFENKEKLYQIPVCFDIRGLLGNRDLIGERSGWTYSEFSGIVENLPSDVKVMKEMEYGELLERMLSDAMLDFIDYTKKNVFFDGDEFRQLLTITKEYGTDSVDDEPHNYDGNGLPDFNIEEESRNDPTKLMKDGKLALMPIEIYNLYQFAEYRSILKNNGIYIGMPSPSGAGVSAMPALTLAISSFSENKDEAWTFIRRLFDEDSQYTYTSSLGSIPLHRKAFDRICDDTIEDNRYLIEQFEHDQTFFSFLPFPETMVRIDQEDAKAFKALIERASTIMSTDPSVFQIVEEETAPFFRGEKSVEDVCRIIQQRAAEVISKR